MFKRIIAAALVFGAAALAPPVQAQTACGAHDQITSRLEARWGESTRALGLQSPSRILEVWVSDETGSWTILFTRPDGLTCIGASGSDWQQFSPKARVAGTPG